MQIIFNPQGYQLLISHQRVLSKQKKKIHPPSSRRYFCHLSPSSPPPPPPPPSIFSHPSSSNFFSYPARSFVQRRGCRRLNDRSTLLATLFAGRFAGLVAVFTYPRERGRVGSSAGFQGRPRRIVNRLTVTRRKHAWGDVTRITEDSFPELCSHKCVHSFLPLLLSPAQRERVVCRVIGGTRCCLSSRPSLLSLKHTFRYTVAPR